VRKTANAQHLANQRIEWWGWRDSNSRQPV
jgi:hypothetical protein